MGVHSLKKHPNANPTNRRRIRPLPELVASVASGSADPWDAGMGDMSPPPPELPVVATGIYQEMPHGALTSFLPEIGVSIDPRSPYAVWAGRYLTRLPYIPSEADPDVNALAFVSFRSILKPKPLTWCAVAQAPFPPCTGCR